MTVPFSANAAGPDDLRFIQETPLAYGTWQRLKRLYKRLEADPTSDPVLLGALIGRLDSAPLAGARFDRWNQPRVQFGADLRNTAAIAVRNKRLYVLGSQWGSADKLAAFEQDAAGDPLAPRRVAELSVQNGQQIEQCGPLVCVMTGGNRSGAKTLNVYSSAEEQTTALAYHGHLDLGGPARIASTADNASFVCAAVQEDRNNGFNGLRVVDLSDPARPRVAGEIAVPNASAVAQAGAIAVVLVGRTGFGWTSLPRSSGLRVINVSDPARPRVAGSLDLGHAQVVTLAGRFAFVGVGRSGQRDSAGVWVVDLSDPARPHKRGFCVVNGEPVALAAAPGGNIVYVAERYGGLRTVDVSDPAAPKDVGNVSGLNYLTSLVVDGQTLYAASQYNGLAVFDLTNPARPVRIGTPPTPATLAYMKRRARRLLRTLAAAPDPDRYAAVAAHTLEHAGKGKEALDFGAEWVAVDVLFGGSGRFMQVRHGRGRYVETGGGPLPPSHLRLRTREERAPAVWNRRPDLLAGLLLAPDPLPWQTHEFALRVLRANKAPVPGAVPEATLERWIASPSPLLVSAGVRIVAERAAQNGPKLDAKLAAGAWFWAGAGARRHLSHPLVRLAADNKWAESFAGRLADLVQRSFAGSDKPLTRRAVGAAALLAEHFAGRIPGGQLRPLLAPLLATGRADLLALIVAGARQAAPVVADEWLRALEPVPAGTGRETVLRAIEEAVRDAAFNLAQARAVVQYAPSGWVRENGWRLLAASATPGDVLRALWDELFLSEAVTPALESAMASPHALGLLTRAGIGPDELAARLAERPFLVGLLTPQAFARVAATAPGSAVLALVAAAPDELWERLRPAWLRSLREGVGLDAAWFAADAAIASDASGRLAARLVDDPELAETFLSVDDTAVLAFRDPSLDTLLGQWARVHETLFAPRSALLLDGATHPLPAVRAWALGRVRETGMDLPFALRLVESGVPPSVAVGKTFFDAPRPGDADERTFALALCDSPQAGVRDYGCTYVRARWSTLPQAAVLRALFEHDEPAMQAFVAELVGQDTPASSRPDENEIAGFDRDVLRAPGRARRAKEQIKTRQSVRPTLDTATLLVLARSPNAPRDADWALAELAKRALAGEVIPGVSVEGVGGV